MALITETVAEYTRYYEEYKQAIYNYILYRVGYDRDTAEDLTSDVFVKAFENFDKYDRKRSFKTWIYTIAHNHLINHLTGSKPVVQLDDTLAANLEDQTEHYGDALDHQMEMSNITALMTDLPEATRELLTLRFVNDLSNTEIAEVLGKDEGAVRTGLSRAIAALRNKYTEHLSTRTQTTLTNETN